MNTHQSSFSGLIERLRDGSDQAAQHVVAKYHQALLAVARRQMGQRLARRVDAEDVLQSAYRSFFLRARDGQYKLPDRDSLRKLLITILLNKTRLQADFHRAAKRDMGQESCSPADLATAPLAQVDHDDPQSLAAVREAVSAVLSDLQPPHRPIIEMRLLGHSTEEIAQTTGRAPRSIRRIVAEVRHQLAKSLS